MQAPSPLTERDQTVGADSKRKFAEYEAIALASYSLRIGVSKLCDAASKRPGNKDPFLTWWKGVWGGQVQLTLGMEAAILSFKRLEAQLDGGVSRVDEWKEQYDVAVNAMSRWALHQQKILAMDQVKKFVAEEEALVAAGAV